MIGENIAMNSKMTTKPEISLHTTSFILFWVVLCSLILCDYTRIDYENTSLIFFYGIFVVFLWYFCSSMVFFLVFYGIFSISNIYKFKPNIPIVKRWLKMNACENQLK